MLAAISHFLKIKVLRNISTKVCIFTSYFSRYKTPHSFAVNLCRSYARVSTSVVAGGGSSIPPCLCPPNVRALSINVCRNEIRDRAQTFMQLYFIFIYIIKVTARHIDIVKFILFIFFSSCLTSLYKNLY